MTLTQKEREKLIDRRHKLRQLLLNYALRFGAIETATQRLLAARFWRLLPRDVALADAALFLDRKLSLWGSAITGQSLNAGTLAHVLLTAKLSPSFLLLPLHEVNELDRTALIKALPIVTPSEVFTAMPIQSFTAPHSVSSQLGSPLMTV